MAVQWKDFDACCLAARDRSRTRAASRERGGARRLCSGSHDRNRNQAIVAGGRPVAATARDELRARRLKAVSDVCLRGAMRHSPGHARPCSCSSNGDARASRFRGSLSALSGSPGGFGANTLARRKQGVHLVPTSTALQHRGSGAAVDVDTLAIGDEAVASGVSPGAAAARPIRKRTPRHGRRLLWRKSTNLEACHAQGSQGH